VNPASANAGDDTSRSKSSKMKSTFLSLVSPESESCVSSSSEHSSEELLLYVVESTSNLDSELAVRNSLPELLFLVRPDEVDTALEKLANIADAADENGEVDADADAAAADVVAVADDNGGCGGFELVDFLVLVACFK